MTGPRQRLDPEQRRNQLLDIGARLFAERPYDEVWIEEVAELAGVSRGLLYYYFPSKRDFFAVMIQRESEHLLEVTDPDSSLPVTEQIAAGLDAYLEYVVTHVHGIRTVNSGALSADAGIREIVDRELAEQRRRILAALDLHGHAEEVAAMAVRGWIAFVRAVCTDWVDHPTIPKEELRALCFRALDVVLDTDG